MKLERVPRFGQLEFFPWKFFAHSHAQRCTALVVHTGRRPATMEFGSSFLLAGPPLGDLEDIYKDDVDDGIASMAKEQADAWALEYQELQNAEAAAASDLA